MFKKIIQLTIILFILNGCGYTPMYSTNFKNDFNIELIDIKGDNDLNNFIKQKIDGLTNTETKKSKTFQVSLSTNYSKDVQIKDKSGKKVWSTKLYPDYHMYFRPGTPKWDPTSAFTNGRKISLYTICNTTVYCHARWNWVRQHRRYFRIQKIYYLLSSIRYWSSNGTSYDGYSFSNTNGRSERRYRRSFRSLFN